MILDNPLVLGIVVAFFLLLGGGLGGCAPVDDEALLTFVEVSPDLSAPLAAGAPIRVRFAEYLDPDQLGTVELLSGDLGFAVGWGYDPVDRALVIIPEVNLRPNLGYRLTVFADGLAGLDGRQLEEDLVVEFVTGPGPAPAPAPSPSFAALAPIIAERCGCHGPDTYPTLTEATLVGAPSKRQPGRTLVVPGRPLDSHLVQRLLPDYPGVRGAQMPPDGSLDPEALRLIISWIEGLR